MPRTRLQVASRDSTAVFPIKSLSQVVDIEMSGRRKQFTTVTRWDARLISSLAHQRAEDVRSIFHAASQSVAGFPEIIYEKCLYLW